MKYSAHIRLLQHFYFILYIDIAYKNGKIEISQYGQCDNMNNNGNAIVYTIKMLKNS